MRSGSAVYYLLTDHLNSTARILSSGGSIQASTYYYPCGGKRGGSYCSLTTRRFISADIIVPRPGNPQSLNRYAYVVNNPLRYTDPTGHYLYEDAPDDPFVWRYDKPAKGLVRTAEPMVFVEETQDSNPLVVIAGFYGSALLSSLVAPALVEAGYALLEGLGVVATSAACSDGNCGNEIAAVRDGARNTIERISVLSGHGGYSQGSGWTTVPEGTRVVTYSRLGGGISDRLGNIVESGVIYSPAYSNTYFKIWEAGTRIPDYTLYPPTGLNIFGKPVTVEAPTRLSNLLMEHMGTVHWAACTTCPRTPWSNLIYDINRIVGRILR